MRWRARIAALDVHPTGPMWGKGELMSQGECATWSSGLAASCPNPATWSSPAGMNQERRALRLAVRELSWERQEARRRRAVLADQREFCDDGVERAVRDGGRCRRRGGFFLAGRRRGLDRRAAQRAPPRSLRLPFCASALASSTSTAPVPPSRMPRRHISRHRRRLPQHRVHRALDHRPAASPTATPSHE